MSNPTIDSVPSCGQENDYRRVSPDKSSDDLADKLERLCCAETEGKFFDCVTDNIQTIIRSLRQLAASEARASEYFDRLGESVAKCMSIDEARQAAESQLQTARKVLDWVESWVSNPVGGYSVHALDGLFGMTRDKIATLHSLDGGISSTDDQSERISRTDEMLRNTSS